MDDCNFLEVFRWLFLGSDFEEFLVHHDKSGIWNMMLTEQNNRLTKVLESEIAESRCLLLQAE